MPDIAPVGDGVSGQVDTVAPCGTYGAWHERDMPERYETVDACVDQVAPVRV